MPMIASKTVNEAFQWLKANNFVRPQFGRPESTWVLTRPPTAVEFKEWQVNCFILVQGGYFGRAFDESGKEIEGTSFSGGFSY
jgi:hypothetical protein